MKQTDTRVSLKPVCCIYSARLSKVNTVLRSHEKSVLGLSSFQLLRHLQNDPAQFVIADYTLINQ